MSTTHSFRNLVVVRRGDRTLEKNVCLFFKWGMIGYAILPKKYSTCSMKNSLPFCGGEIMVEKERVQKEMSFTPPLSFSHPCMICFSTAMTSNNIYQNRKEIIKSDCDTKYLRYSKNLLRYLLAFRVLFLWLFSREQTLVCPDLSLLGPISKSLSLNQGEGGKQASRPLWKNYLAR